MSGSPASAAVKAAADDACTTMQAAAAALRDSADASCPPPGRDQLQAAAGQLRMEVSKVGLLYNQAAAPPDAEAQPLLRDFQAAVCGLCMLYTGLAAAPGAGPTLRASLHATATSVVEACVALVRGAAVDGARGPQLMMLSGFALDMLEAAGRAPLDDRTAVGRAITQVLRQLADAQQELEAAIKEGQDAEGGGGAADGAAADATPEEEQGGGSDGSDFGFGFAAEALAGEQLAVARQARAMLAAVVGLVKAVVRQLLAEREGLPAEAVEGWESALYHVKGLAPVCDDLAAAVYPPQDRAELSSAAEALATGCQLLAEECPAPGGAAADAEGGSEAAAAAALRGALGAVESALAGLAQALAGGGDGA